MGYDIIASNGSFEALEKCLSAQNASCRSAATPFFAAVSLFIYGKIASNEAAKLQVLKLGRIGDHY
jgi:hypothetical protein